MKSMLETTTHCVVFQSFVLYFNTVHCISTLCTVFQSIALWAPRRQLPPEVAVSLNLSALEQTNLCKNGQQTICRTNTDPQETETAEIIVILLKPKINASAKDLFILLIGPWVISNAKHLRKQNDSWHREKTKLSWTRNQMLQRKQFNRNGYQLAKRLQKLLRAAFLCDTPFYFGAGIHTRRHFAGFSAIRHLSSSCLMSHLIRTWRERSINVIFVHNDIKTRRELSDWGNKDTHE